MSNDYLMSNDYMTGGVYRAFIIKKDEARVYIPGLLNKNILDSNNDISNADFEKIKKALPKPLYNSKEIENLLDDKPTPCFVSFENGNMKRPIVLGYFGNGVKSVPGSSSYNSGYSNSQGGTYNGTGTTGSDNGDYVFNKLIEAGASIAGACGVLGNLYAESTTFDPKEQYMGHVGIAQWDVSRFTTLKLYCGSQSLDPYSIEGQTAFLIDELKNDSDWKQRSKKRTNLEGWNNISKNEETELYALKVQEVVRLDFEKCGDQGKSVREDATKRFFKSFSKNGKIVNGKYESSVNPKITQYLMDVGEEGKDPEKRKAKEHGPASGTQCVELPNDYIQEVFGLKNWGGFGNGNDYYIGVSNAYPKVFEKIKWQTGTKLKIGDIVSTSSPFSKFGHVVIIKNVNGNKIRILDQGDGSKVVNDATWTLDGNKFKYISKNKQIEREIYGIARPK